MLLHTESKVAHPLMAGDHVWGSVSAPVIILEYGCYCCPREAQAHAAIGNVLKCFSNDIAYVFRHCPLVANFHRALEASELAEACAARGRFWEMHNYLAQHACNYSRGALLQAASELGFDVGALSRALNAHVHRELVTEHLRSGVRSGVRHVPALFVNGEAVPQDFSADTLNEMVARATALAHTVNW